MLFYILVSLCLMGKPAAATSVWQRSKGSAFFLDLPQCYIDFLLSLTFLQTKVDEQQQIWKMKTKRCAETGTYSIIQNFKKKKKNILLFQQKRHSVFKLSNAYSSLCQAHNTLSEMRRTSSQKGIWKSSMPNWKQSNPSSSGPLSSSRHLCHSPLPWQRTDYSTSFDHRHGHGQS